MIAATSSKSPWKRIAPAALRAWDAGAAVSRTRAWTVPPASRRKRAVGPPCFPVAPVTRNAGAMLRRFYEVELKMKEKIIS